MKRVLITTLFLGFVGAGSAAAAELCNVPEGEWQPKEALQKQLEGEGVTIKKIKIDEGCYEVYGTDKDGKKIENYYDPKTFSLVKAQQD
ncbi:PepSY domain-containing protein [Dongia sp.]|uniref:PepSY domain-containing protein n=1 Tax=Dongia sp. TaxID=1977262 RepID=UPI0035B3384C